MGRHAFQRGLQMRQHSGDGRGVESAPIILDLQQELWLTVSRQRQGVTRVFMELKRTRFAIAPLPSSASKHRRMFENQDAVKQGCSRRHITPRMDFHEWCMFIARKKVRLSISLQRLYMSHPVIEGEGAYIPGITSPDPSPFPIPAES
jgi:hypothetical protein